MKREYLFIIFIILFATTVRCQTLTTITYDSNGNRISKLMQGSSPHLTVTASPEAVNPGQPALLTASGCTGGTIQWSPVNQSGNQITVNPTITTQYTAQCVVNGCATNGLGKATVIAIQCPMLNIGITASKTTARYGEQITLYANGCNVIENGVNIGRVNWSFGQNSTPTNIKIYGNSNTFTVTCSTPYCPNLSSANINIIGISGCQQGDVLLTIRAGNWTDPATWECGRVPTINDEVYLKHEVQVNANGSTKGIILGSGFLSYPNNSFITVPQN